MESKYIPGIAIPPFDAKVNDLLEHPNEWGGSEYVCAIANETGEKYRVVVAEGLGDYVHLAEGLKKLGLIDVLTKWKSNRCLYDGLFVPSNVAITADQAKVLFAPA
jgi:hypothetical protein